MKLSRRCFLSFAVGGAAGTALSPLPWKLTDDLSIWSQNWPWTPVPPDGQSAYVNSTCTLCPGGCGITVRKIDDRAVKIEGAPGHPLNDGGICLLGISGLQLLYGPTRVQTPLKRVGQRGQGRWQTVSWEQAIAEVAEKLAGIRQAGDTHALAAIAPNDNGTVAQLLQRFLTVYGSPNFFRTPSIEDAYEAAIFLTQGAIGHAGLDIENADYVLSFGSALLDGYGSPVRMIRANSRLKDSSGTVVQIEPRLSNTAASADTWLAIEPGAEADLALAMAQAIINGKKANYAFIADKTEGFEAFVHMLNARYTPEAVAGKTGISSRVIRQIAFSFADAGNPLAISGRGKGQSPGSLKEALAVHALNAVVGNINQPGGVSAVAAYDHINWPEAETDQLAADGLQTPRLDGAGSDQFPHARYLLSRLAKAADSIQALLVAEANPSYSLPGCGEVQAAFDKIPFIVSFSSFMDETAMHADLILPNHVYLERYEDVPVTAGVSRPTIGLCRPVVEPQYDTRHIGDSIIQIARALKGGMARAFPWKNYEICLKLTLAEKWGPLRDKGVWVGEKRSMPEESFETQSGKFNLMNAEIDAIYTADDVMPAGNGAAFPLLLIPYDSIRLASRYIGDTPFMIKTVDDTVIKGGDGFVEVNPQTAQKLGLADGRPATLTTPLGEARVRVHHQEGIRPGVVAMPRGLGHTAYDGFLAAKGVNVNQLIGPVDDPASGLDAAWGIKARLA